MTANNTCIFTRQWGENKRIMWIFNAFNMLHVSNMCRRLTHRTLHIHHHVHIKIFLFYILVALLTLFSFMHTLIPVYTDDIIRFNRRVCWVKWLANESTNTLEPIPKANGMCVCALMLCIDLNIERNVVEVCVLLTKFVVVVVENIDTQKETENVTFLFFMTSNLLDWIENEFVVEYGINMCVTQ